MVQIICPNCDAKYNVPEAALGPKGRKVSCANCGNAWHAMPTGEEAMMLSDPVVGENAPAAKEEPKPEPAAEPEAPVMTAEERRKDRARQLAEIRQIVDEVQGGADPKAAPPPAEPPAPEPSAPIRRRDLDKAGEAAPPARAEAEKSGPIPFPEPEAKPEPAPRVPAAPAEKAPEPEKAAPEKPSFLGAIAGLGKKTAKAEAVPDPKPVPEPKPAPVSEPLEDGRDPLRERITSKPDRPASNQTVEKNRNKMLRKHQRRVSKREAKDSRGSGAFTTGILLVLIVVAVLIALYVLAPQISAQVPSAEPILANYIVKVDEMRAGLGGLVQDFFAKIAPLFSEEE
ncbi:zinc-ribbon domain-containing protein [Rhodobacteraceae bacterium NNCM2]|nr:zinc-ribbon domain-containing protein [Coraliihabitans acroporae]